MSDNIIEIDDFDTATIKASCNGTEATGPDLKISKGTIVLHFLRKSIRYKENCSYKKTKWRCNDSNRTC